MAIVITQGPNTTGYVYPSSYVSAVVNEAVAVIVLANTFVTVSPTITFHTPTLVGNAFRIRPEPLMVGRQGEPPPTYVQKNPFIEVAFEGGAAGQASPNASGVQPQAIRVSQRIGAKRYPLVPPTLAP